MLARKVLQDELQIGACLSRDSIHVSIQVEGETTPPRSMEVMSSMVPFNGTPTDFLA